MRDVFDVVDARALLFIELLVEYCWCRTTHHRQSGSTSVGVGVGVVVGCGGRWCIRSPQYVVSFQYYSSSLILKY